jgi:hypothetical protein
MKNVLLLSLFLFFSTNLKSQMTVSPDSVQVEMSVFHPELSIGVSSVKNDYDYEITIKWEKGNVCQGDNWLYAICDSNGCYFSSTVEKLVTLAPGEETNMDMHFEIADTDYAILKTTIINQNDTTESVEIRYFINTTDCEGTTASTDLPETEKVQLFPNPVGDVLHILQSTATEALVYDITGRLVSRQTIDNNKINTSNLENGTFQVLLKNKEGKAVATKLFLKM